MSKKKTFFSQNHGGVFYKIKELALSKRQRFLLAVLFLSLGLFFSEHLFGKFGFFFSVFLAFLSVILFYISMYKDMKDNMSYQVFVLPFFFTLAFGIFYFLIPAHFLTRVVWTSLYAIGLYSLLLSENIFIVASIRTIALLSGARLVSFILTLISYGLLTKVVFSLEWPLLISASAKPFMILAISFLLIWQSIWTVTLESGFRKNMLWSLLLSICLLESSIILGLWPTTSTFVAIFLTGFFYTILGVSHVWFDKRLFRGVIWEYLWVGVLVFFILMYFTAWKG